MDYLPRAADLESPPMSPLTTPPASTPGSSPVPSSLSLDVSATVRTSSRLAARRAQTAIKRNITDLDTTAEEQAGKCVRVRSADKDEDYTNTKSDTSLTITNTGYAPVATTEAILESIAAANVSAPKKLTIKTSNTTSSVPISAVDETKSNRLLPINQPLVWAKGRGSLCEALPYFRAFQGSLHTAKLTALGFLIDQETDRGDVFSAQVIISSVGGGREKDPETGTMVRTKNANDNAINVRSVTNAYNNKNLVAVIAGENHPLYPCKPPHPYAVLGYFHITDLWKEKQVPKGGNKAVTIWRIRFEKADLTEPSWWTPEGEVADVSPNPSAKTSVCTCKTCGTPSKEIFTAGWFCVNHNCADYYIFPGGNAVDLTALTYTQAFIDERTPFVGEIPSIRPPVPCSTGLHGTEQSLRYGFVCPDCGCCNRRVYWNRWVCENKDCQYTRDAPMSPYPAELLQQENTKFNALMEKRRAHWGVNHNPDNQVGRIYEPIAVQYVRTYLPFSQTLIIGGYLVRQYIFLDSACQSLGTFSIFSSNDAVNTQPDGPDALFRTLELTDIGLRRNPAAVVGHKLEGYTRHFQQNFGARYKFGVSVQSKGFSEAPDVILRGLQRLIWAKQVALAASNHFIGTMPADKIDPGACPADVQDFNELLALGYMENDKINYHDDGEKELGPVVAALSLGSPSTMKFRPKMGKGFQYTSHKDRGKPCYTQMLEVPMKHGDIMVMIGPGIQRTFEHTVEPHGNRRFSLTARHIDPTRMVSQEDKDDAAVKGAIPAHAQAFAYDGY